MRITRQAKRKKPTPRGRPRQNLARTLAGKLSLLREVTRTLEDLSQEIVLLRNAVQILRSDVEQQYSEPASVQLRIDLAAISNTVILVADVVRALLPPGRSLADWKAKEPLLLAVKPR
jgi:hypothetical protein